jgi:hypothetical protein
MQQLDSIMMQKKLLFDDRAYVKIFTHDNYMADLCENYGEKQQVIRYTHKGNFSPFKIMKDFRDYVSSRFDEIIIPITNKSGSGYFNVILFAKRQFPESKIWLLTPDYKLQKVNFNKVFMNNLIYWLFGIVGIIFYKIVAIPFLLVPVIVKIKQFLKKMKK